MPIVNKCRMCGHAEAHHGPISGRRTDDGAVLPGRLCYYSENLAFKPDLCQCSGFNSEPRFSFWDLVKLKMGRTHDVERV